MIHTYLVHYSFAQSMECNIKNIESNINSCCTELNRHYSRSPELKGDHSVSDGIKMLRKDTGEHLPRTATNPPTTPSLARVDSMTLNVDNVDCIFYPWIYKLANWHVSHVAWICIILVYTYMCARACVHVLIRYQIIVQALLALK